MLAEETLGFGTADAGLQDGEARFGVDRHQRVEPDEVERDHRRLVAAQRRDPADDRGAAAEGHHTDVVADARVEYRLDFVRAGGQHDRVGHREVRRGRTPAQQVEVGQPGRARQPRRVVDQHVLRADHFRQRGDCRFVQFR